jgi:hypothetical protein
MLYLLKKSLKGKTMQEHFSSFDTLSSIDQKVFILQGWLIPFCCG